MRAWIYCLAKEIGSCSELGKLRTNCIRFAGERRFDIAGISSINILDEDYHFTSILNDVFVAKVDVLIIGNSNLLPYYKKNLLYDLCKKNGITIILFNNEKEA